MGRLMVHMMVGETDLILLTDVKPTVTDAGGCEYEQPRDRADGGGAWPELAPGAGEGESEERFLHQDLVVRPGLLAARWSRVSSCSTTAATQVQMVQCALRVLPFFTPFIAALHRVNIGTSTACFASRNLARGEEVGAVY